MEHFKIYLWIENSLTVVPEFEPDSWFDLLQDLLPVVIEKLVHRVRQQLVLPVEQVVHVDYHLRIYFSIFFFFDILYRKSLVTFPILKSRLESTTCNI